MKLISAQPISFPEILDYLKERKKEAPGGELGYEQANTLEYSEKFSQLSEGKRKELAGDLGKIAKIPAAQLIALCDLLPRKEEEVKLILLCGKLELPEEQVKEIVKTIKKYRK